MKHDKIFVKTEYQYDKKELTCIAFAIAALISTAYAKVFIYFILTPFFAYFSLK